MGGRKNEIFKKLEAEKRNQKISEKRDEKKRNKRKKSKLYLLGNSIDSFIRTGLLFSFLKRDTDNNINDDNGICHS